MIKVVMGVENIEKYFTEEQLRKFIMSPTTRFNNLMQREWFQDPMVREIIEKIDNSHVEMDFSVVNNKTHIGYSVCTLCGGTKALILMKMLHDRIILANMGDNCVEFLERIAAEYEAEGQDLIIVSNYLHPYQFKYIKEVYFYNWDFTCRNNSDLFDIIAPRWRKEDREN